jgi:methylated-DNA-[protein]-cysteine S-methyltransferase
MSAAPDRDPAIARTIVPTPLGPLGLVARDGNLAGIHFGADPASFPFQVERTWGKPGIEAPAAFEAVKSQLEEYFAGKRLVFRLPLDLEQGTGFQRRVWHALLEIPYGRTLSYKDVAHAIGQPSAVRAVGSANGANPLPIVVPCHRVISSDGTMGGYGGGLDVKQKLLALETRTRAAALRSSPRPDTDRPTR